MHSLVHRAGPAAVAVLALTLLVAGGYSTRPSHARAAETGVTIASFRFGSGSLTVSAGDTVRWTNTDSAPHTATSDAGVSPAFSAGTLAAPMGKDQTAIVTFHVAGTYTYHCEIHPSMKGTVVVQAAGSPAAATPTATSTAPAATQTAPPAVSPAPATPRPAAPPATGQGLAPAQGGTSDVPLVIMFAGLLLALGLGGAVAAYARGRA